MELQKFSIAGITAICMVALPSCLSAVAPAQNPVYRARIKPEKATATILAISSTVHMVSGNQDTYIAELSSTSGEIHGLAKLVDRYRGYDDPIRRTWLVELHPLVMRLVRDEGCDLEAAYVHLPARESDIFDGRVRQKLKEQGPELLPCFLIEHRATQLAR